jgi:hypothetical protein
MADIEITDEASLEAWLKTRPRRDAEIIAFRAAARVFPLWGRAMEEEWVETEAIANELENTAAAYFRFLLILLVKLKFDDIEFEKLEAQLYLTYHYVGGSPATRYAMMSAINAGQGRANNTIFAAVSALAIVQDRRNSWKMIDSEFTFSKKKQNLEQAPLWPTPAPDWFTTADRETRAIWAKDPLTWAFWEKWWDGVISGDMPFPPDLLRDVALIEDDIWQAGPKAVAERINLLIQRHALQREAAAINARLMEFIAINEGLGANLHNQPPDDELSPVKLRATLGEISQALKEIEVALDGPEISPEVVVGLAQRLKDLWDGLTTKMKIAIGGLAIVCVTGFSQFSSGFMGAAGEDFYQLAKRNIDIPSFSRRLLDFGKELEKLRNPAPVFPPRSPIDL